MEFNYITLFKRLANDVGLDPYTIGYCIHRTSREGFTFLSVTLPKLSKAVLSSLEKGYFDRPLGFAYKGKSLRVFSKFLREIFDEKGAVRSDVNPYAIKAIRTVCEYFYKYTLDFSEDQLADAEVKFIETDDRLDLLPTNHAYVSQLRKDFETFYPRLANAKVDEVLKRFNDSPGPGTFSAYKDWEASNRLPWYVRKDNEPSLAGEYSAYAGCFRSLKRGPLPELDKVDPGYSEVLFVPKDSRGPRTIVREPFSRLVGQMAFNRFFADGLNHQTHGRINFVDQSVNRELARNSSITREWATLDLKDASDSVDYRIMKTIFQNSYAAKFFVLNSTRFTKLPSGRFLKLNKLAGMGSGLTFPCMSLLIHLSICRSIVNHTGLPYREVSNLVYVYGDDIIVPTKYVRIAVRGLEAVKLQVNVDKSFVKSHFRESCGGDYYNGFDVSPVRLKMKNSDSTLNNGKITFSKKHSFLELERHARELVKNHLSGSAEHLYRFLEKHLGKLPLISNSACSALGRYTTDRAHYEMDETGTYKNVRVLVPVPAKVEAETSPYVFLARCLRRNLGNWWEHMEFVSGGSAFGVVTVPRQVRYKRVQLNGLNLI